MKLNDVTYLVKIESGVIWERHSHQIIANDLLIDNYINDRDTIAKSKA